MRIKDLITLYNKTYKLCENNDNANKGRDYNLYILVEDDTLELHKKNNEYGYKDVYGTLNGGYDNFNKCLENMLEEWFIKKIIIQEGLCYED